jgi:hypothetical protein
METPANPPGSRYTQRGVFQAITGAEVGAEFSFRTLLCTIVGCCSDVTSAVSASAFLQFVLGALGWFTTDAACLGHTVKGFETVATFSCHLVPSFTCSVHFEVPEQTEVNKGETIKRNECTVSPVSPGLFKKQLRRLTRDPARATSISTPGRSKKTRRHRELPAQVFPGPGYLRPRKARGRACQGSRARGDPGPGYAGDPPRA